jgi:hypothetical protein
MTRDLPQFPNLDHLRKQAKLRLREMRQRNPNAKLSESQHAVAGDYGFPSWAKLKAHIETLPPRPETELAAATGFRGTGGGQANVVEAPVAESPGPALFPRFTEQSRRLIFFARYFAARRGGPQIEPEDLLLALREEDPSLIDRFLFGSASAEFLGREVERRAEIPEGLPPSARIPLSSQSRRILEAAAAEADALHHEKIKPGHFLLGALQQTESQVLSVLEAAMAERGIQPDQARAAIVQSLNGEAT